MSDRHSTQPAGRDALWTLVTGHMVEYAVYFERIPGNMRARLLGITGTIGWLSVPAGRLVFGFLLDWLALDTALLVLGLAALPIPFAVIALRSLRIGLAARPAPAEAA